MPETEFELIKWSENKNCHKEKEEWVCQLCDEKEQVLNAVNVIYLKKNLYHSDKKHILKSSQSQVLKLSMLDFGSDTDDDE